MDSNNLERKTKAELFELIQSKQAEIDELNRKLRMYEKHVNAIRHIHKTQFDYESDTSWVLGNLDGFFEYLEADLKGEKYDH